MARLTKNRVVAIAAQQFVITAIDAESGRKQRVEVVAIHGVGPVAAIDEVVAIAYGGKRLNNKPTTDHRVVAGTGRDRVVAALSLDVVVARAAEGQVVAAAAADGVVSSDRIPHEW